MTAEIAAAIASFYYSNNVTDSAKKTYREGWTKAIVGYETNEDMKNFVDLFQSTVRENNYTLHPNVTDLFAFPLVRLLWL